jgi:hypothetical protein
MREWTRRRARGRRVCMVGRMVGCLTVRMAMVCRVRVRVQEGVRYRLQWRI